MKTYTIGLVALAVALTGLACEEEAKDPKAWGTMQCDQCNRKFTVDGKKTETGLDYDVECAFKDDRFSFTVNTANPGNLTTDGFFYQLYQIGGLPVDGAYSGAGYDLKEGFDGFFRGGQVANGANRWTIKEANIKPEYCTVTSFGRAIEGELTPPEFGNEKFEYAIHVDCVPGLDAPSDNTGGSPLTGLQATLWFAHCD